MRSVRIPIRFVFLCQVGVINHQQVFRITILGRLGEIKGSRDDRSAIDHHDFIVRDRMGGIDERGDRIIHPQKGVNCSRACEFSGKFAHFSVWCGAKSPGMDNFMA